jgi:YD repeat-containing protein
LVNTANLNLLLTKALFLVPGRGIAISDGITYNSYDVRSDSPLGVGWHLASDTKLELCQDGRLLCTDTDGSSYYFRGSYYYQEQCYVYTGPPGVYSKIRKKDNEDFYAITDKNQNVYSYDLNGKPINFKDRDNNVTTFTYYPDGKLNYIEDDSGRRLTYVYYPDDFYPRNGLLYTITDPGNRTYQFSYEFDGDNNPYLKTITDPNGQTVTLGYDSIGMLATFTDPLSNVTTFTYDNQGNLQSIKDARTTAQDVYATTFSKYYQNNEIRTTVTDPGNKAFQYYHDDKTGNLTRYIDATNTWYYQWLNNNLTSFQNSLGTTTYEYDGMGNITRKTQTVDSNPANNIVETMTYSDKNELLEKTDGSGRKISLKYDAHGNRLSTATGNKEANGKKYDSDGNLIEQSGTTSSSYNLLNNGNMEIPGNIFYPGLLKYWTRIPGNATASLEGFDSHGNSALKISAATTTTELFCQPAYQLIVGDKLTLRADVKFDNIQTSGSNSGVVIKIQYTTNYWEAWYLTSNGTESVKVPVVLTSQAANTYATIVIGIENASGTVWFDGVQLEKASNPYDGYILSEFNSVENSSFEQDFSLWWAYDAGKTSLSEEQAWGGTKSAKTVNTSAR